MPDSALARENMVLGQIQPHGVTDERVNDAFRAVERERFVPAEMAALAYIDEDIEVAPGRWLMEPVTLARLAQAAQIEENCVVLDIGCVTGYSSAFLSRLASAVVALEEDAELAAIAAERMADIGVDNVTVVEGKLTDGCPDQGPYDVILLGGSVPAVPDALLAQLGEGGRLLAVVGEGGSGTAMIYTRTGDVIGDRSIFSAAVPLLPGFLPDHGFRF